MNTHSDDVFPREVQEEKKRNQRMAPLAIRLCCGAVRWSPVIFISAIIIWSYYAYVVQMCFCKFQGLMFYKISRLIF